MLYYIFALIKALFTQPRNIKKVTRQLYKIWRIDKISKKLNEVVFIDRKSTICGTPQLKDHNHHNCSYIHLSRIVQYIGKAKYSIDIAVYTLNSVPISRALHEAWKRGINVRIITEKNFLHQLLRTFDEVNLEGIPIVVPMEPTGRIMHHKFCIVDGYRRVQELRKSGAVAGAVAGAGAGNDNTQKNTALLITGSVNWIGCSRNYDDLLITSNVRLVLQLEREFLRIWKGIELQYI